MIPDGGGGRKIKNTENTGLHWNTESINSTDKCPRENTKEDLDGGVCLEEDRTLNTGGLP